VPPGTYTPYNAQATIHHAKGLFATLLPATVPGRVSDIWRGYFAERIFKDVGLSVAFVPPRVAQLRNAHNYLGDMDAESDLYFKTDKLLEFLETWLDKSESQTLVSRMEALRVALLEREYIESEDVVVLQLWLRALVAYGYKFPVLFNVSSGYSIRRPSRRPGTSSRVATAAARLLLQERNDWSACAGDHMLYPPNSAVELFKARKRGENVPP